MEGMRVRLYRFDDGDLQLFFAIDAGHKNNLKLVNEWNTSKRLSRAYVDSDGDYVLESDLEGSAGLTGKQIDVFLGTFALSLDAFKEML